MSQYLARSDFLPGGRAALASFAFVALASLAAPAAGQEPVPIQGPAARALFALDDRANEAWMYGLHVLSPGYPGASAAESQRALAHGARLIAASSDAAAALEGTGRADTVALLAESATSLGQSLCPEVPREGWPDLLRASERAFVIPDCETTSSLIEAVRDHASDVSSVLREATQDAPRDCAFVRRIEARHLRSAVEQARVVIAAAHSINIPEERRESVSELRKLGAAVRRPGAAPGRLLAPAPRSLGETFPAPLVERYGAALAAWSAAITPEERTRLGPAVAAAARALASAPNPLAARIVRLGRSAAALERALGAWRAGASEPVVSRALSAARGDPDIDDIVDDLVERLREPWASCPGR